MDVIRGVLTEEDAVALPMDMFRALANCASDIVVMRVNSYLKNPKAEKHAKFRTADAFGDANRRREYYGSEDLSKVVEKLRDLTYSDINVEQPMETLVWWRDTIDSILKSEYAVAYIAPMRADNVKSLCDQMFASGDPTAIDVATKVSAYMNLFKDAPFKGYTGTPVKRIISNRSTYETYLKGLNFVIEKKKSGEKPSTWRLM